jgi:hypothetical protein
MSAEEELAHFVARMRRAFPQASSEDVVRELAARGNDKGDVLRGFSNRQKSEEEKERGNALVAKGRHHEALLAYTTALRPVGALGCKDSALDRRLRVALHCNRSGCFLALKETELALDEARKATSIDATFEKAWLRLGMALEATPGGREEALEVYRRIAATNAVAAERIAVLEPPRVVVTTEGLSGVPNGSLDLLRMERFPKPTAFFGNRIMLPSEPLAPHEPRASTHEYGLRALIKNLSESEELANGHSAQRHTVARPESPDEKLCFDSLGQFVTLPNVAEDGRNRMFARPSSNVPIILVALWTGKGDPPLVKNVVPRHWTHAVDHELFKAMLVRNAALLTSEVERRFRRPGYLISFLTHVAVPELDYSIHEGCSALDCKVDRARYRCSRCFVARYCGEEHMTAHWKQHKPHCVPLAQRQPQLSLTCKNVYADEPEVARHTGIDCIRLPRKTFPGVVVIKIQMFEDRTMKISDPNGVIRLFTSASIFLQHKSLEIAFLRSATIVGGFAVAYFDADMSVADRLVFFMDRAWKCTW